MDTKDDKVDPNLEKYLTFQQPFKLGFEDEYEKKIDEIQSKEAKEDKLELQEPPVVEYDDENVKKAQQQIQEKLNKMHCDRDDEKVIIEVLKASSKSEISLILMGIDLKLLIYKVDDRLVGPDRRSELLNLLCNDRLGDLSIDVRARLITAIQQNDICKTSIGFLSIKTVMQSTYGTDLSKLKRKIDLAYSSADTFSLLYESLPDKTRDEILEHINSQAQILNKTTPIEKRPIKILSDIDDTVFASLFDISFPKGKIYPGLVKFYEGLDVGRDNDEEGDLVFLTARPGGPFELFRKYTYSKLKSVGMTIPFTMCTGSIDKIISNRGMAQKKFENFQKFRRVYPEFRYVFNGDSGQGDILAGKYMLDTLQKTEQGLLTIFIHDIQVKSGPNTPSDKRKELWHEGIHLYDSYITAATIAFQLKLMNADSLRDVIADTNLAFDKMQFSSDDQKNGRLKELQEAQQDAENVMKNNIEYFGNFRAGMRLPQTPIPLRCNCEKCSIS